MARQTQPDIIRKPMVINVLASYRDLIQNWINGNLSSVIEALSNDHSGLTAMFLVQGFADGSLTPNDLNVVANMLIEERQNLCR